MEEQAVQEKKYAVQDYKSDLHNDWCPGCGDFGILTALQNALANLGLAPHQVAVVSGVGCSGKTPHYLNTYGFHTLHGRVLPMATGIKLANREITLVAVGGDGDGYGIGGGQFVAGGRRNLDFTYIIYNNDVYALTKGQASPTVARGKKTKSMPEPSILEPIHPVALALSSGYTFVARGYALDVKHLTGLIQRGIEHRGSALIDVYQTCPTYNDLHSRAWYAGKDRGGKSRIRYLDQMQYDPVVKNPEDAREVAQKKLQALEKAWSADEEVTLGVYYQIRLPTLEENLAQKMPALQDAPLAEQRLWERDITPLFEELT